MKRLLILPALLLTACTTTVNVSLTAPMLAGDKSATVAASVTTGNAFGENSAAGTLTTTPEGATGAATAGQSKAVLGQVVTAAIAAAAAGYLAHGMNAPAPLIPAVAGAGGLLGWHMARPATNQGGTTVTQMTTTVVTP